MKTLNQSIDTIISTVSGGISVDESNLSASLIELKIHEARAYVILTQWAKSKAIHPDWLQRFYPEYNTVIQEERCYFKFKCPGIIYLDQSNDGLQYIGSRDYSDQFRRVRKRGEWSDMKNHPGMGFDRKNYGMYEAFELYLKAAITPEDIMTVAAFSVPTDIPTFNKAKDPYPLDPASLKMAEDIVIQLIMTSVKTPADDVSNSSDDTKMARK